MLPPNWTALSWLRRNSSCIALTIHEGIYENKIKLKMQNLK